MGQTWMNPHLFRGETVEGGGGESVQLKLKWRPDQKGSAMDFFPSGWRVRAITAEIISLLGLHY